MARSRLGIKMRKLEPWVPSALGALFFVIGAVVAVRTASFVARSQPATGTVVDWELRDDMQDRQKGRQMWYPVLEFADARGERHTFRGGLSQTNWARGEKVPIRYDPSNPADARMAGGLTWLLPVIFMLGGGTFSWLALVAQRRERRASRPGLGG
jgi:hypothetical protein